MILNLGSLAFNANILTSGGTPAWGTEMGQGEGYKFVFEDMSSFFIGMVYKSVPDLDNVSCPLGKGGNQRSEYDFVIASLFDKIYVNGKRVDGASFLLLIVKKINGDYHVGRRTLKYNPRMTYKGNAINDDCFQKIAATLNLSEDASWFIHEINIINQDELHFKAFVLGDHAITYKNNEERRNAVISKLHEGSNINRCESLKHTGNHQLIFYGAPGTGKSHTIKEQTEGEDVVRTTFHPDTDYSTFVGTYKPTTEYAPILAIIGDKAVETGRLEKRISYEFVCQAFLQAYVKAWKKFANAQGNTPKKQFLVIEEINRGNCAQIFGDLFQLLDRNDDGFSEYPITADADMQKQLKQLLKEMVIVDAQSINALYKGRDVVKEVLEGKILLLPNNLFILATMNTSDQSLFPIDSAFKRRWDWKYIPITEGRDENGQPKMWKIEGDTQMFDWWSFIKNINDEIYDKTHSEDKKLGYYFCKSDNGIVKVDTFVSKVLFYLWNDVFKDFASESSLFTESYDKFYDTDSKGKTFIIKEKVQALLVRLKVKVVGDIDENDNLETNVENPQERIMNHFKLNDEGRFGKARIALEALKTYSNANPEKTGADIVEIWSVLGIANLIETSETHAERENRSSDQKMSEKWNELRLPNGEYVYITNQFPNNKIESFINAVNAQPWNIRIEKIVE